MSSSESGSAFRRCFTGASRPLLHRLWNAASFGCCACVFAATAEARPSGPGGADAEVRPGETSDHYVQYGVGLAAETVIEPGAVCPEDAEAPCIFGSGAGLMLQMGYRSRGPWYIGGSYEFSRQDASNLIRLPILQQLRADLRYYLDRGDRLTPYALVSAGVAVYGNEWGFDTGGLVGCIGIGLEFEVSRTTLLGGGLGYRPIVFRRWTDSAGQLRADESLGFGVAHVLVLEVHFELREPLPRW